MARATPWGRQNYGYGHSMGMIELWLWPLSGNGRTMAMATPWWWQNYGSGHSMGMTELWLWPLHRDDRTAAMATPWGRQKYGYDYSMTMTECKPSSAVGSQTRDEFTYMQLTISVHVHAVGDTIFCRVIGKSSACFRYISWLFACTGWPLGLFSEAVVIWGQKIVYHQWNRCGNNIISFKNIKYIGGIKMFY